MGSRQVAIPILEAEVRLESVCLKDVLRNPVFRTKGVRVKLVDQEEYLLVLEREVIWTRGAITLKRLKYGDDIIVDALFTKFMGEPRCLVVVLREHAYVYFPDGNKHIITFPFHVRGVFASITGLIVEKEAAKSSVVLNISSNGPLTDHMETTFNPSMSLPSTTTDGTTSGGKFNSQINFLTLSKPLGEYGTVVSSSTSSFSSKDSLVLFPHLPSQSLAVTYNSGDSSINIYHVRHLSQYPRTGSARKSHLSSSSGSKSIRRPSSLRKPSTSSQTPSKLTESDDFMLDTVSSVNFSKNLLNYDKLRVVSESLSIDRMASGTEIIPDFVKPTSSFETSSLKKDVVLTKLETIAANDSLKYLSFHSSSYQGQQCIVINNSKKKQSGILIFKLNNTAGLTLQENYLLPCVDCILVDPSCGYNGLIAVLKDERSVCLANPFIGLISSNLTLKLDLNKLHGSFGDEIAIGFKDSSFEIHTLMIKPKSKLIGNIFESLKYLSNSFSYEFFWMRWSSALGFFEDHDEWKAFVVVLLSVFLPDEVAFDDLNTELNLITSLLPYALLLKSKTESRYSLNELAPKITLAMHIIREDIKLDLRNSKMLHSMSVLLTQLTFWMGWSHEWQFYYGVSNEKFDRITRFLTLESVKVPLNLLESLASLFEGDHIVPYLSFSQLASESERIDETITPRTFYVLRLFEAMISEDFGPVDVVNMMIEFGIKLEDLDTYPISISVALKESVLLCQADTPIPWTELALELVGRKDILKFLGSDDLIVKGPKMSSEIVSLDNVKDINKLLQVHEDSENSSPWDGQAESDRINVTKLVFFKDRRFLEITTILQSSRIPTVHPSFSADIFPDEYDRDNQFHKAVATVTALRTLTIPLGRGALFLSSRMPLMTERFPIPKLNFSCAIPTSEQTLTFDKDSLDHEALLWGFFHNGASSGLTISRDAEDINGGWIVFNQPPNLNAQHGGFLLGLGLNGHLKKLDQWHIYNYLGPKHPYTSIGLLLGMSASLRGSMDVMLTKVLSVHVLALLPQGATDLKVGLSVQTAGLIGIGLLYLETQHHRMSEILLSQIHSKLSYEDEIIVDEGYRLAAGISLGYINLGCGDNIEGLNDSHVVEKLLAICTSQKDVQSDDQLDKSAAGAILALTFIYMKTGNERVASKLALPETEQLLDYVRPDLILLRCLGSSLIMWDKIEGTDKWIQSQIPLFVKKRYQLSTVQKLESDQLILFHTIGGLCLTIGLKFASSMDQSVLKTLLYYLEEMMRITSLKLRTYDENITMVGASTVRDIIAISCSIIMAGSGNLDVFRRLRVLYGKIEPQTTYGNFMATNLALGFLFLGGGQFLFSTSSFAIAALITSIYPIFPSYSQRHPTSSDAHLQALRHFWALAVEPRCLIIRDVETLEPVQIPVKLTLVSGEEQDIVCPSMIPSLDEIASVETLSNDHLKLYYDFDKNQNYFNIFKKKLTLYVYKKDQSRAKKTFKSEVFDTSSDGMDIKLINPLAQILQMNTKDLMCPRQKSSSEETLLASVTSIKNELLKMAQSPLSVDDLWNLKILFKFSDSFVGDTMQYLSVEFIERLKVLIWKEVSN